MQHDIPHSFYVCKGDRRPTFNDNDWDECVSTGDFGYVLFEWYRWVGNLTTVVAFIRPDSADFAQISKQQYHLWSALMARLSRLMLSIIALTHKQEFGEAAAIIHRSVMETAVKLIWVCKIDVPDRTKRLIADGLKPELEFEHQIRSNINAAGGELSPLEQRMLNSIDNHFLAADLTKSDVTSSAKMPDLASMFNDIGWSRLQYVILQRLGSHAVHGNWPSLLSDYLEEADVDGFDFMPRGQPVPMHPNLYMSGGRLVLNAIVAYSQASLSSGANTDFVDLANEAHEMLIADYKHAIELGL